MTPEERIAELERQLEESQEAEPEVLKHLEEQIALQERLLEIKEQQKSLDKAAKEAQDEQKAIAEKRAELEQKAADAEEKYQERANRRGIKRKTRQAEEKKYNEEKKKLAEEIAKIGEQQEKIEEKIEKNLKSQEKLKRRQAKLDREKRKADRKDPAAESMLRIQKELLKKIPGGSTISNMMDMGKNAKKYGKNLKTVGRSIQSMGNAQSFMGRAALRAGSSLIRLGGFVSGLTGPVLAAAAAIAIVAAKAFSVASAIDKASDALSRSIATMHNFRAEMQGFGQEMAYLGLGNEEYAASVKTLQSGLTSYNAKNKQTNQQLVKTTATLQRIGVSGQSTAKTMDVFNMSLGQSQTQAAETAVQIALMGEQMGVTAEKALSDFTRVANKLTMFGNESKKIFQDLQALEKTTGVGMDKQIELASKFDNYDSAASYVANLNAYLGTNLDHVDLMKKDYGEIAKILHEEIYQAGKNIDLDELADPSNRHHLRAMAEAASMTTDEFLRMAQSDPANVDNMVKSQEELTSAEAQQKLADMNEKMTSFGEAMSNLGNSIVVNFLGPLITVFGVLMDIMAYTATKIAKWINVLKPAFLALGIIILALVVPSLISMASGFVSAFIAALPWIAAAAVLIAVLWGIGAAIMWVWDGMKKLWGILTKSGSPSFSTGMFDFIAKGVDSLKDKFDVIAKPLQSFTNGLQSMWAWWHKDGSPMLYELPEHQAGAHQQLAKKMQVTTEQTAKFSAENENLHKVLHQAESPTMNVEPINAELGGINVNVNQAEQKAPIMNVIVKIGEEQLKSIIESVTAEMVGTAV